MGWRRTFDPLDEDGEVVDGDSLAAHSELWRPGWEVDGFCDESGDIWNESGRESATCSSTSSEPCLYYVPRMDVIQIVTSGWLEGLMDGDSALMFATSKI